MVPPEGVRKRVIQGCFQEAKKKPGMLTVPRLCFQKQTQSPRSFLHSFIPKGSKDSVCLSFKMYLVCGWDVKHSAFTGLASKLTLCIPKCGLIPVVARFILRVNRTNSWVSAG